MIITPKSFKTIRNHKKINKERNMLEIKIIFAKAFNKKGFGLPSIYPLNIKWLQSKGYSVEVSSNQVVVFL